MADLKKKTGGAPLLQVIDLHTLFASDGDKMLDDGIHPDSKGAKKMAEIIAEAIKK